MSEDYYKARIGELERELEAANAENVRLSGKSGYCLECERLARENESLTAIINQYDYAEECQDEQKLWELYRDSRKLFFIQGDGINLQGGSDTNKDALENAQAAFKVWKERER